MPNSNDRILHILKYMWENTDETHPTSISQIKRSLLDADIPVKDSRTIRSDLSALANFGLDIVEQRKQQSQYFIGRRHFEAPYAMLWNNDSYYVAGYSMWHGKIVKFRIDRIDQLHILDDPQVQPTADFDVSEFFSQEFSMLDGTECWVELLCENALMNSIIDRFGETIETSVVDGGHFKVSAKVDLSGTFYGWVFSSAGRMKIVGPQAAVEGF